MSEHSNIIYIFKLACLGDACCLYQSIAEDGSPLGNHVSSSIDWAIADMTTEDGENSYVEKYPNGYELIWINDDERKSHEGLYKAIQQNKETYGAICFEHENNFQISVTWEHDDGSTFKETIGDKDDLTRYFKNTFHENDKE